MIPLTISSQKKKVDFLPLNSVMISNGSNNHSDTILSITPLSTMFYDNISMRVATEPLMV